MPSAATFVNPAGRLVSPESFWPHATSGTTPTTASVIAGIQIQEAIKLLHGLPTLSGSGFVFDGLHHQSYTVAYSRQDDCPSHEADDPVVALPWRTDTTTVRELLNRAPDPAGFATYEKLMREKGMDERQLRAALMQGDEYRQLHPRR